MNLFFDLSLLLSISYFWVNPYFVHGECPEPPNFPSSSIELVTTSYENWSKELHIAEIWEAYPKTAQDVVTLANWAKQNNYTLRPRGGRYSWAPLTFPPDDVPNNNNFASKSLLFPSKPPLPTSACQTANVILLATETYLTQVTMNGSSQSVTAQTGITLNDLTQFLENKGYGLASLTAIGNITLGGVLATGSHGTGLPLNNDPGRIFGTISNLVLRLQAVVWNATKGQYELQWFERSDPKIGPLMANLGRAFVTQATLRVGQNERIRCLSITDIPTEQIFAKPDPSSLTPPPNSYARFVEDFGSVGLLYYPFTKDPWVRIWSKSPVKPENSKETNTSYNYAFEENYPDLIADIIGAVLAGNSPLTVEANNIFASFIKSGLLVTDTTDLWGWSKNTMFYVKPSTVRVSVSGFAILCSRSKLQGVLSQVFEIYDGMVKTYQGNGKYPLNGPLEIRSSPIDNKDGVIGDELMPPGAIAASFTGNSPLPDRPELDTCLWVDISTLSKTNYVEEFMFDIQSKFYEIFNGQEGQALIRPEWSKRWGYSQPNSNTAGGIISPVTALLGGGGGSKGIRGPWTNGTFMESIPQRYSGWKVAAQILSDLDPHGIFKNPLFKPILP